MNDISTSQSKDILLNEWDPIGIKDFCLFEDEYDNYVNDIRETIISDSAEIKLRQYLQWLEETHMGLKGNSENRDKCIQKLLELSESHTRV